MSTGGEKRNGLLSIRRRNTFSGGTSSGWKGRRKRRGSEDAKEEKRLSCVLEDISASGSTASCSQLVSYRREEKVFPVEYKSEYRSREEEEDNRAKSETALKAKKTSSSSNSAAIMAWRASRCGSPSTYETLQHNAVPPTTSSSSSSAPSSWIDSLRLLTEKGGKKKGNGLFGTLRGRSGREKSRRDSSESVASSSGGSAAGAPRSPLLLGRHLHNTSSSSQPELASSSNNKTSFIKKQKLYIGSGSKRSLQGQSSTGFQTMDATDNRDFDSSLSPLSLSLSYRTGEFGSCHELSYEYNPTPGDRTLSNIRKSNSLPRTVLCSPVHTRRGKGERPTSHWLPRDLYDPTGSPASFSPPRTFSRNGSSDTLQNEVTTPTEMDDWRFQQHSELVQKMGLTRSSSMPFEAGVETVKTTSVQTRKRNHVKEREGGRDSGVGSEGGENGRGSNSRLTTRSQSFNTHFTVHTQETVVMREHIVRFLLETEHSYILSLRTLSKGYHNVLSSIDCQSLKEVLSLSSRLAEWHEEFSALVNERLESWQDEPSIGDILINTFSQDHFMKLYSSYIEHYSQARSTLEAAKLSKASLCKALEDLSRENHGKLSIEDLLIKPVQRIPRYLLFVKDLIKQTHTGHHDYNTLLQAQSQLSMVASHVNEYERQSGLLHLHKELLNTVEGLSEVLTESSSLLRCDQITEIRGAVQKKDRLLMLFNDQLVCASTRRRSTGFRKGSLMNVNSVQNDLLKYRIKWSVPSTTVTINQCHTPLIERRKYNTLEKTLHNLLEDEAILLQMSSSASSLHSPHQELHTILQEMLGSLRDVMSIKRQEMDNLQLPHERARVDITIHDSSPPNKVSLTFSSQKERQEWEHTLRSLQLSLPLQQETSTIQRSSELIQMTPVPQFMWHVTLPSCRVGSELSSIAAPTGMANQLFVCINDVCGRGNVAILNSRSSSKDTPPQLVATLPLSSSRLICSLCVEHKNITLTNAHSLAPGVPTDGNLPSSDLSLTPPTAPSTVSFPLEPDELLGPSPQPFVDKANPSLTAPTSCGSSSYIVSSGQEAESRYNLAPPTPEGNQWLWLGTEEGILHVLKVGAASLHVSSSLSVDIGAAILCLHSDKDYVWVGLASGRIALFNTSQSITRPERFVSVSSYPIKDIVGLGACKLVATGNRIVGVNAETLTCKELVSLSDQIDHMIIPPPPPPPSSSSTSNTTSSLPIITTTTNNTDNNNVVFISIKNSLTVHVCTCDGVIMETVLTVDCSSSVTSALKYYDPIIKKHKCTNPYITSLSSTHTQLLIGTSAGVLITLPLPLMGGATTPKLHPLTRGHVDRVSTLLSLPPTHSHSHCQIFISGGHGLEDINKARACDNVSETEGCLLFWYLLSTSNTQQLNYYYDRKLPHMIVT